MRKPSESLYELALSLSSREKAYFRKYAQNQVSNGNPEYLRLFNAILEQKDYNEAALKGKVSLITSIRPKNFSTLTYWTPFRVFIVRILH